MYWVKYWDGLTVKCRLFHKKDNASKFYAGMSFLGRAIIWGTGLVTISSDGCSMYRGLL